MTSSAWRFLPGERRGGGGRATDRLGAEHGELTCHLRLFQGFGDVVRDWSTMRAGVPAAAPGRPRCRLEIGQARFGHRRHVGQGGQALLRRVARIVTRLLPWKGNDVVRLSNIRWILRKSLV